MKYGGGFVHFNPEMREDSLGQTKRKVKLEPEV